LKAAGIPPGIHGGLGARGRCRDAAPGVNARAALNPASTMKLVTTYAALDLLGPAYTWKTEAHATRQRWPMACCKAICISGAAAIPS
jgi:D-alanyl-D-alanine carboxypeptidase/D-alanyl-D-alanine-endopeptidase (penicillin-binding protein 4)